MTLDLDDLRDRWIRSARAPWHRALLAVAVLGLLAGLGWLAMGLFSILHITRDSSPGHLIGLLLAVTYLAFLWALWMIRSRDPKYSRHQRRLMERAQAGEARSQRELAEGYLHGAPGIHRDAAEAVYWYRLAARGGDAEAAYALSNLVKTGHGAQTNPDEARRWLDQAVQAGYGPALERLSRWEKGEPEPLSIRKPAQTSLEPRLEPPSRLQAWSDHLPPWLRDAPWTLLFLGSAAFVALYILAAFTALVLAAYTISPAATLAFGGILLGAVGSAAGALFVYRSGAPKLPWRARILIRRAEYGHLKSQRQLAEAYMEGRHGLVKDPSQAVWWLQRCAQRDPAAAYLLAQWIDGGLGHHRNRPRALQWLEHAAGAGHGPSKVLLDRWRRQEQNTVREGA